ncbi:hypothetical protein GCM10009641_57370 [Mycobacterium cookii]|nr:hypothetical protein [Nocardioides furvisabuli]
MTVVDDRTSLDGGTIDVAARTAWTLRMARLTAQVDDNRMKTVAAAIGTSPARLSRAETGQLRDGSLVDGYERVLGLPEGSLRAPIDVLARTFPWTSAVDARPGSPISTVSVLSELTERLEGSEDVTGGEWLRWARAISVPGNVGLPTTLAQRIIDRLVQELSRSCGHGYPTRYEALAKVRCSDYGFLVLRSARHEVDHPHAQGLGDLLSAVGEAATPDALQWCLGLLRAERPYVAMCGALALENMAEISPRGTFWSAVVPALVDAYDVSEPGSQHEEWIAHLIRLAPASTWASASRRPARPLPPAPEVEGFERNEANRQWKQCVAIADEVAGEAGVGEQPMLARMLFDIGFGHWESRAVTAYLLLGSLPALAHPLWDRFGEMVDAEPDERLRHRMARRLHGALAGRLAAPATGWLESPDPVLRSAGMQIVGSSGGRLPLDVVRRALADPDTVRAATYSIGMGGHPVLPDIVADASLHADVRGSAAWWLERGPRVAV